MSNGSTPDNPPPATLPPTDQGGIPNEISPAARALYEHEKGTRLNPYEAEANQAERIVEYLQDTEVKKLNYANPQVTDDYAPLSILIQQTLRRYGNFAPGTVDGETKLMLLEFANNTIEDLRMHPYWDDKNIRYYKNLEDKRAIPDEIMRLGLSFYYANQQDSTKMQTAGGSYYRRMNAILYERKFGDQRIKLIPMDGGSRPLNQPMPEKAWDGMRLRDPREIG